MWLGCLGSCNRRGNVDIGRACFVVFYNLSFSCLSFAQPLIRKKLVIVTRGSASECWNIISRNRECGRNDNVGTWHAERSPCYAANDHFVYIIIYAAVWFCSERSEQPIKRLVIRFGLEALNETIRLIDG